jgi:acrylyl-CoA reductase (NADPH)
MFRAILLTKNDDGSTRAELSQLDDSQLPSEGDVTVAVEYSTINYKDGLAITGKSPVALTAPVRWSLRRTPSGRPAIISC